MSVCYATATEAAPKPSVTYFKTIKIQSATTTTTNSAPQNDGWAAPIAVGHATTDCPSITNKTDTLTYSHRASPTSHPIRYSPDICRRKKLTIIYSARYRVSRCRTIRKRCWSTFIYDFDDMLWYCNVFVCDLGYVPIRVRWFSSFWW